MDQWTDEQHPSSLILKTVLEASSTLVLEEVLTRASISIAETIGVKFCGMYLLDKAAGVYSIHGRTGRLKDPTLLKSIADNPVAVDDPLIVAAASRRGPLVINDASKSDLLSPVHKEVLGIKSLVVIPLFARQKMVGFAMLPTFDKPVEFEAKRVETANGIASAVALAIDNAQLFERSQDMAVVEERNRLAQEIHDGLAQRLTGVVLQLEAAAILVKSDGAEAEKRILRAMELARESLDEARRSVRNLRPRTLEDLSLVAAIRKEIEHLETDDALKCSFSVSGKAQTVPEDVEHSLLRIAQESLANVRRHAQATLVDVRLEFLQDRLVLTVADDGVGFEAEIELADEDGYGLQGIRERAVNLGGSCQIDSQVGKGTKIAIEFPLPAVHLH